MCKKKLHQWFLRPLWYRFSKENRINYYNGWLWNCTEYLINICKQNNPSHGEVKMVHIICPHWLLRTSLRIITANLDLWFEHEILFMDNIKCKTLIVKFYHAITCSQLSNMNWFILKQFFFQKKNLGWLILNFLSNSRSRFMR